MDIFSLPNVFLRQLMRTLEIRDRLRLRLTCRAFEQLVAEAHAGYFDVAGIYNLAFNIGKTMFNPFEMTDDNANGLLQLRTRFFDGIRIGHVEFELNSAAASHLDFIRKLCGKFKIEKMTFRAYNDAELDRVMQFLSTIPRTQYRMHLWYIPNEDRLQSLHPIVFLSIRAGMGREENEEVPSTLFLRLLDTHKNVESEYRVALSSDDFTRIVQVISEDNRERRISFSMPNQSLVVFLRYHGVTATTKYGDVCGEFKIINCVAEDARSVRLVMINGKCGIVISGFSWTFPGCRSRILLCSELA